MSEDHPNPFNITLVVEDGKEFQAHRNVLSQASPFFEKLLNTDMKENNEGVIRLEWITESLMADILQFIYTGNVQISTQENAEKLMATADYLLLSNLKTIAGKFFEQHITTVNCISVYYAIAEQYSCEDLIASTRKFINSNFTTIAASDDFLNLPSHEVEKWISSDEILIDAEENVFEIIIRWINRDKSERGVKFGELFRHVRLTCMSRDFLLCHVVTNDLVRENENCVYSVTGALNWINRSTDCDVPRPHSPRNSLMTSLIVITDISGQADPCCYHPATDGWYHLPAIEDRQVARHVVSKCGKLFAVTRDITRSQCYDPDLNRWSSAPWTELNSNLPFINNPSTLTKVLVVKNQICFIVNVAKNRSKTTLWTYSLDSNSLTPPLINWVEKVSFCAVAVDRYIYVIGGRGGSGIACGVLSECARFETEADEWQNIAPLNVARASACGVCKNENIFIAGGTFGYGCSITHRNDCEVYNIPTDEWQLIASLTFDRTLQGMVLVDNMLVYVLGRRKSFNDYTYHIECYDHERNEWKDRTILPVSKMSIKKIERLQYGFKSCPLSVFKGVLNNLESVDRD